MMWTLPLSMLGWIACAPAPESASSTPETVAVPTPPTSGPWRAEVEGLPVRAFVPEHPVGLVFVFHGTGAGVGFVDRHSTQTVLGVLADAGYAWIATSSTDRDDTGQWDTHTLDPADNRDVPRLLRLAERLASETALTTDVPWFTMGMSNGGAMAITFAHIGHSQGWPVRAVAAYSAPVDKAVREAGGPVVPTLAVLMAADEIVDSERLAAGWKERRAAGVTVEIRRAEPYAVSAADLATRTPLDLVTAERVMAELRTLGVLDANGMPAVAIEQAMRTLRALPEANTDVLRRGIKEVFRDAWALHTMTDRFATDQVQFFEAHRRGP